MSDADTIRETLVEKSSEAQSLSRGGNSVTQRSLRELIEAEKHVAGQNATQHSHFGLRFTRLVPPGCG